MICYSIPLSTNMQTRSIMRSDILAQAAFYMSLHLQFLKETHTQEMKAITDICEDIEAILPSQE